MTTTLKTCFKCGAEKPLTEFYKHSAMGDGHLGKCKECTKSDVKAHRLANIDRIREYDRSRGSRQTRQDTAKYRKNNRAKCLAHGKVGREIRAGRLIKKPCEICGERKVHGHHDDYAKPLEVRWLCPIHHHEWHMKNGEGLNGDIRQ